MRTSVDLANVVNIRDNNFNLIRMVAATLVIFSHSYALALGDGVLEPVYNFIGITLGHIAVDVFFVTSGFLVLKSLINASNLKLFVISRVLRIYPALLVSVIACSIMGLFVTDLSVMEYAANPELKSFILYNSTMIVTDFQFLPGVFHNAPFDRSVNGSLYTLPWELRMYFILFMIGAISFMFKSKYYRKCSISVIVLLITCITLPLYLYDHINEIEKHWFYTRFYRFTSTFFFGGALYVLKDHIKLNSTYLFSATFSLMLASLISQNTFFFFYVLISPYIVLCVAYLPKGKILDYNKLGDFSYGTYIYAWPVQQLLAIIFIGIQPFNMFFITFCCTCILSVFSWKYIEKPAMSFKKRLIQ